MSDMPTFDMKQVHVPDEVLEGFKKLPTATVYNAVRYFGSILCVCEGLENFTKGIGVVGPPRFTSLGICEVDMAVTVAQVVEEINRIRQQRRVGPRIEEREIIKQRQFTEERVVVSCD